MKIICIGDPLEYRGFIGYGDSYGEDYGGTFDEVYPTLEDWKLANPVPTEDTILIGVGVTLPPADDPYYAPHNDGTYLFEIENQTNFIKSLLIWAEEVNLMLPTNSIKGSDIKTAGVTYVAKFKPITHIRSLSSGDLSVQLSESTEFETIAINAENSYYPVAEIEKIDPNSVNTTVDLDDVVFGQPL